MVDHKVENGSVGVGKSGVEGKYLLRCTDEDSQTKMVLTETQLRDLIERLSKLVPVVDFPV
jgi:hypothetical protein